jgi:hypothetical protein
MLYSLFKYKLLFCYFIEELFFVIFCLIEKKNSKNRRFFHFILKKREIKNSAKKFLFFLDLIFLKYYSSRCLLFCSCAFTTISFGSWY